jgi:hypothetical protein
MMTPRARSSGGPPRLVLRVVRVDVRVSSGPSHYSRASAPRGRMLAAGWARWFRVGLAPCSMASDAGHYAAIPAIHEERLSIIGHACHETMFWGRYCLLRTAPL